MTRKTPYHDTAISYGTGSDGDETERQDDSVNYQIENGKYPKGATRDHTGHTAREEAVHKGAVQPTTALSGLLWVLGLGLDECIIFLRGGCAS